MNDYKKKICIALCGKTGSGKSEVAKFLEKKYSYKNYSFFQPAREYLQKALPNVDYHTNLLAREIAIEVVEAPKRISSRCWAWCVTEDMIKDQFYDRIVISDLRFNNELDHINEIITKDEFGGGYELFLVKIEGDYDKHIRDLKISMTNEEKELLDRLEIHYSNTEHENFAFDYILKNVGTLEELHFNIKTLIEDINFKMIKHKQ